MRYHALLALALLAVLGSATAGAVPADGSNTSIEPTVDADGTTRSDEQTSTADQPRIHAVYPNPVAGGDRGEFVVLALPPGANLSAYTVTDGQTVARLPNGTNRTDGGQIAVTTDPGRVRELVDRPVVRLRGSLTLANGGDAVRLRREGETVDTVRYEDATEGNLGVAAGSTVRWGPLGATDRPVVSGSSGDVRAFVLPDAPNAAIEPLRTADDRIFLAGYTLTSERVADALIGAHRRGADVRVLVEGEPVGGRTQTEARTLDRLATAGIDVRVIAGPHARYDYHHAKYAVADDRAVVLTENWKPAGTGGNSSRGWGVETRQPSIVDGLVETFRADAGWRDTVQWREYRRGRQFERSERATTTYSTRFEPTTVPVERTDLLVTPDNAQRSLVSELDQANESVAVVQPTIGDWDAPLVRALRRAAGRGVEVRLLLSDAWYVREENQRTAERFAQWADRTGAPMSVRLADPSGRYSKIHAKGAVVDEDRVVLGSLNWNEQAATSNREVLLVLHGEAVADYYGGVFDADWRGGDRQIPLGLGGAVLGVVVLGVLVARRTGFDNWAG